MKKALLVLTAIMLVFAIAGCSNGTASKSSTPTPGPGGVDLVEKVVYQMSEDMDGVQALTPGNITFPSGADAVNPIKPLIKSGDVPSHLEYFRAVEREGTISLQYKTVADWGPGIDLANKEFAYYVGDKIEIKGEILSMPSGGKIQLNKYVNSENATIGGSSTVISAAGPIDWNITLAEADMDNITKGASGGGPAGIRLEARGVGGIEVRIDEIIIKGKRPSVIVALPAPVLTLTGSVLSWQAIPGAAGYALYNGNDSTPFFNTSDTQYNLAGLEPGTHSITVVAKGVSGISKDSPKSAAVSYTKEAGPTLPTGFFELGPPHNGTNTWFTNGRDGNTTNLTAAKLAGAKYLILELESVVEQNGFGTIQPALQTTSDGDSWHDQAVSGGWNKPEAANGQWDIAYNTVDTFYIVIDLTQLPFWSGFVSSTDTDTKAKILLNSKPSQINITNGYLADTTVSLTKPATALSLNSSYGWAAKTVPELTP